ncbi:DotU family type IV/VI secretion system protein [Escherichia coli]|uniref:DotU family type IV/VI secretion system protein n=1 Tax=Escherichia coli TaxID=562 RepID=UPI00193BD7B2|nr:DotU family type IV/VI secretion system protein [Escherichia coli]MBM2901074.1 DotU family type IV/VI secretion system protein [Escherichia coli]
MNKPELSQIERIFYPGWLMASQLRSGQEVRDGEGLYRRACRLVKEAKAALMEAGYSDISRDHMVYALCALLDESVMNRGTSDDGYLTWHRDPLSGGELHADLMALLHVYLGSRLDVRLQLCVDRSLLPDATMSSKPNAGAVQLGRTAVMRPLNAARTASHPKTITINLGRYERVQENIHRRETDEDGDYRW